tara:strand:- start:8639 stop:9523 length:885 start_codon:yes stop_codon:yes gene_type:complete
MNWLNDTTTVTVPTTDTTTTDTTTTKVIVPTIPSAKKVAVCFGINNYPGTNNDLKGCINDAKGWEDILKNKYGYNVNHFYDTFATTHNFVEHIENLLADSKQGTHVVVTYSGHGTNVRDNNSDEADGRDEALCLFDRVFIDDEVRNLFKKLHPEARLTFISDSCHSGTVTRAFLAGTGNDVYSKPRYLPPEDDDEAFSIRPSAIKSRANDLSQEGMDEVLITGCLPKEFSYDARLGGDYYGAMTFNALEILNKTPNITYEAFYSKLRKKLPSNSYRQTPQLEGSARNKQTLIFS